MIERFKAALMGRRGHPGLGQGLDIGKPRGAGNGPAFLPYELHAVVIDGVMAGGHHAAAVDPEGAGGEVHFLRATEPDIDDVGAQRLAAPGKGGF